MNRCLSPYHTTWMVDCGSEVLNILRINAALSRAAGSVRVAGDMLLHAIHEGAWQLRYLFLWIALEALFAADNPAEARYRLNYRLALFLRGRGEAASAFFRQDLKGYDLRSAIAHGLRDKDIGDSDAAMADVEDRLREALSRILLDDELLRKFGTKERDAYLESLVLESSG